MTAAATTGPRRRVARRANEPSRPPARTMTAAMPIVSRPLASGPKVETMNSNADSGR